MKETLKKLVTTGEIEEALRVLLDFLEKSAPPNPLLNTAITLSSKYNASKQSQGLDASEEETNQIIPTLLELIDRIEEVQPDKISVDASDEGPAVQKISQHFGVDSPQLATLLFLLSQNSLEWQPQLPLLGRTGWSAYELDELASRYPEFIRRQQRNNTTVLYAAQPRCREQIKRLLDEV